MKRYRKSRLTVHDYSRLKSLLKRLDNKHTAEFSGYSMSTVNLVNRTKDFDEYQEYNNARKEPKQAGFTTWTMNGTPLILDGSQTDEKYAQMYTQLYDRLYKDVVSLVILSVLVISVIGSLISLFIQLL